MKRGLVRVSLALFGAVLCTSTFSARLDAQDDYPRGIQLNEEELSATAAAEEQSSPINTDHGHGEIAASSAAEPTTPAQIAPSDAAPSSAPEVAPATATLVAKMVGEDALTPLAREAPSPLVQATATSSAPEIAIEPDADDFAKLKLDMAISSFKLNPDSRTRNMVIDAYQSLVIRECYSQVYKNLTYVPPGSAQCQAFVSKLLQFESQNPLAICARDGFDAVGCRSAYRGQTFRSFSERSSDTELDQVLDLKRHEEELGEIQNRISNLRSDFEIHKDAESHQKLLTELEQGIEKACRSLTEGPADEIANGDELLKKYPELARIVSGEESGMNSSQGSLANMVEPTTPAEAQASPTPLEKPYAGLLRDLAPESSSTKIEPTRYRNASPYCYSFVSQLLEFEPFHPRATCLRDGPYSPGCLLAVKRQREAPPTARAGATSTPKRKNTGGLATF